MFDEKAFRELSEKYKDISRKYSYDEVLFKPYKVNPYNMIDGDDAWLRNTDTEHKMLEHIISVRLQMKLLKEEHVNTTQVRKLIKEKSDKV